MTALVAGGCAAAAAGGEGAWTGAGDGDGEGDGDGDGAGDGDGDDAAGETCATVGATRDACVALDWPHAATRTMTASAVSLPMQGLTGLVTRAA